ncbi:sensor domain-containing diguanylate cyclase [Butyrivibrio sp. AE2032]|uniref:sensor domain-containing diguanylate cyclase n=1 Tax=Butyrivibrio sp. AE2032 TaxID=1458463 RepID=UPI0005556128|nr:GGDEF domain-containing protein [Butyrivibrio sp. AE2032]
MDFQAFVDNIETMTCVISVEMKEDGNYGDIRLVAGNKAYVQSIEAAWDGPQLMSNKFVPNSIYQNYFPKDLNFETVCYRAAVEKHPVHTYVHPERFDFWFDLYLIPLKSEGNMHYCTYTQVVTQKADTKKMANLSQDTASAVLNTCIKLSNTSDFDHTIQEVVKDIREICGAFICCILSVNPIDRTCRVLAEASSEEGQGLTMQSILDEDPNFYENVAEQWEDTIGGSNCLILKNRSDMEYLKERNPVWYESMTTHRVESIVLFPMKFGEELLGYIWATNFDTQKTDQIKETMELTTFFVASSVASVQLIRRLKILSSVDMLTGVLNRNEMNERIERIVSGEDYLRNLGIVFADINGLKRVNDEQGHFAGDRLLKHAAELLRDVFKRCDVYRAGGDEFMIIIPDTGDKELEQFCSELKSKELGFGPVGFATGYSCVNDSQDIRKAMHTADERMYLDKAAFYEKHPELKR